MMKRFLLYAGTAILGLTATAMVIYFAYLRPRPYAAPAVAFTGNSTALQQSVVVPTLDTPAPPGKNVIWCGAMQLGWNRFETDVLKATPAIRGAEATVARLNQGRLREQDLAPDSYLATAGLAKDGIARTIADQMKRRFQRDVELDPGPEDGAIVYSYLEAEVPFTIPYFDNREAFSFRDSQGTEAEVSSFGIEEKHEYAYHELRDQVHTLFLRRKEGDAEKLDEFAVDLCRDSAPNQIVLACIPRQEDLQQALDYVERKTRGYELTSFGEFGVRDVLLVPNLNWEIRHRFAELEGSDKPLSTPGFEGNYIDKAEQLIRFRLDRSGAELMAEFKQYVKPMATFYLFDRPFLISIRKRGCKNPFFVMWVDNAELLSKP